MYPRIPVMMSEVGEMLFRVAVALAHCVRIFVRVGFFRPTEERMGCFFGGI